MRNRPGGKGFPGSCRTDWEEPPGEIIHRRSNIIPGSLFFFPFDKTEHEKSCHFPATACQRLFGECTAKDELLLSFFHRCFFPTGLRQGICEKPPAPPALHLPQREREGHCLQGRRRIGGLWLGDQGKVANQQFPSCHS